MTNPQKSDDVKKDNIVIEDYDQNWPRLAKQEINKILGVITDDNLVDIQHIGSTSIPMARAKPIIDIYIGVKSIDIAKQQYIDPIVSLGYVYWDENPNANKLFFVKGMPPYGEKRTHHIHVVKYGSDYWRDRIAFRNYLRLHPGDVQRYNELKIKLALDYQHDREAYTEAKNQFIVYILQCAGIKEGGER